MLRHIEGRWGMEDGRESVCVDNKGDGYYDDKR